MSETDTPFEGKDLDYGEPSGPTYEVANIGAIGAMGIGSRGVTLGIGVEFDIHGEDAEIGHFHAQTPVFMMDEPKFAGLIGLLAAAYKRMAANHGTTVGNELYEELSKLDLRVLADLAASGEEE